MNKLKAFGKRHEGVFVLAMLLTVFICLIVGLRNARVSEIPVYRLALTKDGCAYLRSIGLKPTDAPGGCQLIARYDSGSFGSNGHILLDDDRFIEVGNGTILGVTPADGQLPNTPGQKTSFRLFVGAIAGMLGAVAIMFFL
jgi:hypothetical protein